MIGVPAFFVKRLLRKKSLIHSKTKGFTMDQMTWVYKPGSVLTAIYLDRGSLHGSSRLLGTVEQTFCPSTALLRDRVYIVKPMLPWAGCALTAPFHPYSHCRSRGAVSLCCTCPGVTPGGRYPLSLLCGARTFLIWSLSASIRGCPTQSFTIITEKSQIVKSPCKIFWFRIYYCK